MADYNHETDWEEAINSLKESCRDGDIDHWEIELVRRRVMLRLDELRAELSSTGDTSKSTKNT